MRNGNKEKRKKLRFPQKKQPIKIKNVFEKDILCVKTKIGTEKIVAQNGMFEFSLKVGINKIVKA